MLQLNPFAGARMMKPGGYSILVQVVAASAITGTPQARDSRTVLLPPWQTVTDVRSRTAS